MRNKTPNLLLLIFLITPIFIFSCKKEETKKTTSPQKVTDCSLPTVPQIPGLPSGDVKALSLSSVSTSSIELPSGYQTTRIEAPLHEQAILEISVYCQVENKKKELCKKYRVRNQDKILYDLPTGVLELRIRPCLRSGIKFQAPPKQMTIEKNEYGESCGAEFSTFIRQGENSSTTQEAARNILAAEIEIDQTISHFVDKAAEYATNNISTLNLSDESSSPLIQIKKEWQKIALGFVTVGHDDLTDAFLLKDTKIFEDSLDSLDMTSEDTLNLVENSECSKVTATNSTTHTSTSILQTLLSMKAQNTQTNITQKNNILADQNSITSSTSESNADSNLEMNPNDHNDTEQKNSSNVEAQDAEQKPSEKKDGSITGQAGAWLAIVPGTLALITGYNLYKGIQQTRNERWLLSRINENILTVVTAVEQQNGIEEAVLNFKKKNQELQKKPQFLDLPNSQPTMRRDRFREIMESMNTDFDKELRNFKKDGFSPKYTSDFREKYYAHDALINTKVKINDYSDDIGLWHKWMGDSGKSVKKNIFGFIVGVAAAGYLLYSALSLTGNELEAEENLQKAMQETETKAAILLKKRSELEYQLYKKSNF